MILESLLFLSLSAGLAGESASTSDIARVKEVLTAPRRDWSRLPYAEHAEDLRPLGDRALDLLASLLEDYDLGDSAAATMLEIDENRAAPMIFRSMPRSDRNVQFHTFQHFLRRLDKESALPFPQEMHDAAVRCLEANTNADAAEIALKVVGLTGSKADYPILKSYFTRGHKVDSWGRRLKYAALESLARLHSESHLRVVKSALAAPLPRKMDFISGEELSGAIHAAGASRDARFIPLLCRHLLTPGVPRDHDVIGPQPAWSAAVALDQIVNGASEMSRATVGDWKPWCESKGLLRPN